MFGGMLSYFKTMWELHKILCGSSAFFISSISSVRTGIVFQDFVYNCRRDFVAQMRGVIKHEFLDYEGMDNDNRECVRK